MSAAKHDRHAAFVRFDERLQRFHKQHPTLFNIATIILGLILFGIAKLIESLLKGGR